MFTQKVIKQGLKALDTQLKQTGTITSRLTAEQRAGLLEMFAKWKSKSFKLLPSAYSYAQRSVGTIDQVEGRLTSSLNEARKFVVDEKFDTDTVECHITYGHSLRVNGCVPMNDAALIVRYTRRFQRLEKEKKAKLARKKAARDSAKQAKLVSATAGIKDLAKLIKELKQLKLDNVPKKAAKKKVKTKKKVTVSSPFEK